MTHADIDALIAESERIVASARATREASERERAEWERKRAEREQQAHRRYEFQERLSVLDETRNTCGVAWVEIDNEVERINEEERLARLEDGNE